jgi:hypothetical protein
VRTLLEVHRYLQTMPSKDEGLPSVSLKGVRRDESVI